MPQDPGRDGVAGLVRPTKSQSTLQGAMDALKQAKTDFDNEPSGPGKGAKSKAVGTKKADLKQVPTKGQANGLSI